MCGRFALFAAPETIAEYFDLDSQPAVVPWQRYNLTPGQAVAVVREQDGRRRLDLLRWGLVPFWAKDASIGQRLINARLDSIAAKPAFREAFVRRRCLIAASGFYEWGAAERGRKQPFYVRPSSEPLLAFAGLWERWRGADGQPLETCVIVTTDANVKLAPIHNRMPLFVARADHGRWLDPRIGVAEATELVARAPALDVWPVATTVNNPRNDDESLIAPLADVQ